MANLESSIYLTYREHIENIYREAVQTPQLGFKARTLLELTCTLSVHVNNVNYIFEAQQRTFISKSMGPCTVCNVPTLEIWCSIFQWHLNWMLIAILAFSISLLIYIMLQSPWHLRPDSGTESCRTQLMLMHYCVFHSDLQLPGHAGGWESQLCQQDSDWAELRRPSS